MAIIDADVYCTAYKLNEVRIFAISMKNLEYLGGKKARLETDPRTVIPAKYYNLSHIFFKKDSDTCFFYQKYDHKIIIEKRKIIVIL